MGVGGITHPKTTEHGASPFRCQWIPDSGNLHEICLQPRTPVFKDSSHLQKKKS